MKYLKDFIACHDGTINRIIHIVGFFFIGIGILQKSLFFVIFGAVIQEMGHVYQYTTTHKQKYSLLNCLKPQSMFALPLFILIILYVVFAK